MLAGALGLCGDVRGCDYVRKLLASDDERALIAAAAAMESLATAEDVPHLVPLLERSDPILVAHAIGAIGRTGDPRGLPVLAELRESVGLSGLWGDVEDAEAAIRAHMELRGGERPDHTGAFAIAVAPRAAMEERK